MPKIVMKSNEKVIDDVRNYYSRKIIEYGSTPRGVDWNSEAGQSTRFSQLCKIFDGNLNNSFSITDYGCGYGALIDYLSIHFSNFEYYGYDISNEMIAAAKGKYSTLDNVKLRVGNQPEVTTDYCIASGIFNVKLHYSDEAWFDYICSTLDILNKGCRRGFAFNCLTSYCDDFKKQNHLYYANPCYLFDICKRYYSRNISLLHDYELYEFTILVRK